MFDVAIIGAGLAGLTCAQQLHQAGYSVVIVEKSRGVGGRLATRRLHNTLADHGVRYLEPQGKLLQQLISLLVQRGILQVWIDRGMCEVIFNQPQRHRDHRDGDRRGDEGGEGERYEDFLTPHTSQLTRYVAPTGMTAVAKFLATSLEIWQNRRVQAITPTKEKTWHLTLDSTEAPNQLTARAVVLAIPAPQALMLLESLAQTDLPPAFLDSLRSVEFDPCLSVIAGYSVGTTQKLPLPTWKACTLSNDSDLAWIGLDSSKRPDAQMPVFVLQSTANFAKKYLDAEDLNPAGKQLLSRAAQLLIPWLNTPDWFQVHRWRYAFPRRPLDQDCLNTKTPLPLVCCGDWCGGNLIESALASGLAAAAQINNQLGQFSLPIEEGFLI